MKKNTTLILLLFSISNYCQGIDSLITVTPPQTKSIINDSLTKAERINKVKIYTLGTTYIRENPSFSSKKIKKIQHNSEVTLLDYDDKNDYFKVSIDSTLGYISELSIYKNKKTRDYIQAIKLKSIKARRLKNEEKTRLKNIELDIKYTAKYGKKTYNKLKQGYYWIGMTKEMTIIAIGEPSKINKTVGSWGTHEQWVYSNYGIYLYFKNGKLNSYQN